MAQSKSYRRPKKLSRRGYEKYQQTNNRRRDVANEKQKVQVGKSGAFSSKECLDFHNVPPSLYTRIALRYTSGRKKYGIGPTNLNWRIGLDEASYVADRLNHMFTHMVEFLEHGNEFDDNLGAIAWCAGFLMEVEKHAPEVLKFVIGHGKLYGKSAKEFKKVAEQYFKKGRKK